MEISEHGDAPNGPTLISRVMSLVIGALPATSERLLTAVLDRYDRRRGSPLSGALLFASGVVAGSVATAFVTPVSGPELRKRVLGTVRAATIRPTEATSAVGEEAHHHPIWPEKPSEHHAE